MASLDDLITQALSGIIGGGGLPNEEALYQRQQQAEREGAFSRGLGISSVTRDALAKARVDAALAAQSAQLSALGQAASLQQAQANRAQQGAQFTASLDQQKKALSQQRDIANQQLLAGGLGAGAGAALQLGGMAFRPEITRNLRGLFGLGQNPAPVSPLGGSETMLPPSQVPSMPSFDASTIGPSLDALSGVGSLPDISIPDLTIPDTAGSFFLDTPAFDLGSTAFDLSGLFDYNPYQWGDYL